MRRDRALGEAPSSRPEPAAELCLAYLLELRLRARSNPEALGIVDRALSILARADGAANLAAMDGLRAEVQRLEDDLALCYGAPRAATLQ
jgi:hypothetical protein